MMDSAQDGPVTELSSERECAVGHAIDNHRTAELAEAMGRPSGAAAFVQGTKRTVLCEDSLPSSPKAESMYAPNCQDEKLDLLDAQAECRRLVRAGVQMHEEILLLHRELSATRLQVQALLSDQRESAQDKVKLQFLEARVDALLHSASWRITKPLRLLYRLLVGHA